jgi:rfaE bifunctional protein nucleotidyltransferase chain/domain
MSLIHAKVNEKDTQIANNHPAVDSTYVDYKYKVCTKPWGYEFLAYESDTIAIWYLKINRGESTSLHCHFEKDTNIIVLQGSAKIGMIDDELFLNTLSGIHIPKTKFHSISSFSEECYLLEIEIFGKTKFSDKNDLLRVVDPYKREKTGYESSVKLSENLDKYFYFDKNFYGIGDVINKVSICISDKVDDKSCFNILLRGNLYNNGNYYKEGSILSKYTEYEGDCKILSLNKIDYAEDNKIIYDINQLKILKKNLSDKKVVLTSGCFDIIHVGHLNTLKLSKNLGDILIVCLSNDEQIKKLKGENRPINNYADRIELFKTILYVDYIVLYDEVNIEKEETLDDIINILDPLYWTKGTDYTTDDILKKHPTIRNIELFDQINNKSTTNIINKIRESR